jgi:predicted TIM-barrel fold metal-dependent hydrolase
VLTELRSARHDGGGGRWSRLSTGAATLPALLAFTKPGHTVFGSDWPFAPQAAVDRFTDALDHYPGLDEAQRQAINRDNAVALFSR